MKITLDRSVNAAYIYLDPSSATKWGVVKKTVTVDPKEIGGMINLDFDENGMLFGIEVLDASKFLPKELLDQAEIISK